VCATVDSQCLEYLGYITLELGSNSNQNNNSAGGRTQNFTRLEIPRSEMSRGVSDLSRGFLTSEMRRGVSDRDPSRVVSEISRVVSDLSTIGEESNPNQNNNSADGRTQNLGMHTIVEEDIRRLRRNGGEPIPGWQNPAYGNTGC
jgi:hypothetical protein